MLSQRHLVQRFKRRRARCLPAELGKEVRCRARVCLKACERVKIYITREVRWRWDPRRLDHSRPGVMRNDMAETQQDPRPGVSRRALQLFTHDQLP